MKIALAAAALALALPASAQTDLGSAFSSLRGSVAAFRAGAGRSAAPDPAAAGSASPAPQIGANAPDFDLRTPDGQRHGLNDYADRVVVLVFWSSWAAGSRSGAPARAGLAGRHPDAQFLDIGVGDSGSGVAAFAAAAAPAANETILLDPDQSAFAEYGGATVPLFAVISKTGQLVALVPGADAGALARVEAAINAASR